MSKTKVFLNGKTLSSSKEKNYEKIVKEISKLMKNNETIYDMFADKKEKKFSEKKRKLSLFPRNKLPQYILNNESKLKEWLD